jgi:hypothetical protein
MGVGKKLEKIVEMGVNLVTLETIIGIPITIENFNFQPLGEPVRMVLHDIIHNVSLGGGNPTLIDSNAQYAEQIVNLFPKWYELSPGLYERTGFLLYTEIKTELANVPTEVIVSPLVVLPIMGYLLYANKNKHSLRYLKAALFVYGTYLMAEPALNLFTNLNYQATDIYKLITSLLPNFEPNFDETLGIAVLSSIVLFGVSKGVHYGGKKLIEKIRN